MWELICFATLAATYGYDRFEKFAFLDARVLPAPLTAIGLMGLATLQGFAMMILAYGVLIPNTRRRSLMAVAGLFAVAIAAIPAAAAANPLLLGGHVFGLVVDAPGGASVSQVTVHTEWEPVQPNAEPEDEEVAKWITDLRSRPGH
jgi:hypothetical protein